ncbi:GNAT family N-acetyltransferase [Halobaculum sp. EA56]|uniref:GNAT family N-acetyltransferase n=1 Tax=Halobaculum sp. EA56 TaxID=3421648 RepID=UPI003EBF23F0
MPADADDAGDRGDDAGVVVDRANTDDVDAVADLWVELARGQRAYGSHLRSEGNRNAAGDAVARAVVTGGVLVARAADPVADGGPDSAAARGVVGFVTFGRESGGYRTDVDRGTVYNLYVRPPYRDGGVGALLLSRAEAALADDGADVVGLEAMAGNVDAIRFYERNGYERHRVELEKSVAGRRNDSD